MGTLIDCTNKFLAARGRRRPCPRLPRQKTAKTVALLRQVVEAAQNVLYEPFDQFHEEDLKHLIEQAEAHLLEIGGI